MQTKNLYCAPSCACAVRQVDEDMMQELKDIKANIKPSDTLLVVDAMTGQVRGWGGMGVMWQGHLGTQIVLLMGA